MKLIASVDNEWNIGNKGGLLFSLPDDMKFFRTTTSGKIVVMGRKTLESFPGSKPLKNRVNIVITRNPSYKVKDAVVVHSVEEAIEESRKYDGDVFVIGGESIYRAMLPYCDTALVTRIDYAYEADTWFPNLDEDEEWELTDEGEEQTCFDLEYAFTRYERK